MIRTCTVSKLLDSDSSHSSFTLRLGNQDIKIVSGLIASCKEDGCNSAYSIFNNYLSQNKYFFYAFIIIANIIVSFNFIN